MCVELRLQAGRLARFTLAALGRASFCRRSSAPHSAQFRAASTA